LDSEDKRVKRGRDFKDLLDRELILAVSRYPKMTQNDTDRMTLYALAAHAVGDFLLQPTWMGENKLDSRAIRALHVVVYTVAFVPVVIASKWTKRQSVTFLGIVATTHFAIDSDRWSDTFPILFDQVLHGIALVVSFALTDPCADEDCV
jgi:TRAP-type uncharacterized transport system fused permease subunit